VIVFTHTKIGLSPGEVFTQETKQATSTGWRYLYTERKKRAIILPPPRLIVCYAILCPEIKVPRQNAQSQGKYTIDAMQWRLNQTQHAETAEGHAEGHTMTIMTVMKLLVINVMPCTVIGLLIIGENAHTLK
jgi:hypothetical protein